MSDFKKQLAKEFKEKRISLLSDDNKKSIKEKALSNIYSSIENKENKYIFYSPDIPLVNPLVKLIYEIALEVKNAGYNVVMLHELNGYKAHWLYNSEGYEEYKSLPVEYIMKKQVGKKSRKTSSNYSFSVSDTLIVTDAYQDILENILHEETLKLIQKIVLVTGYMGLASMNPGMDYNRLGVNSLVFFDDNIKEDYNVLFDTKSYIIDNYPISKGFKRENIDSGSIVPNIALTCIGNNDKAQQLINIFYNKYPQLSMFTFSIIGREDMDTYIDAIKVAAAVVILDKNIVTKQMFYETINLGTPTFLPSRREFLDNKTIIENFVVNDDVFDLAAEIATFCQNWLDIPTSDIQDKIFQIADEMFLKERTFENFNLTVVNIFNELQDNRLKTFENLLKSI